jgi:hypothetical protein
MAQSTTKKAMPDMMPYNRSFLPKQPPPQSADYLFSSFSNSKFILRLGGHGSLASKKFIGRDFGNELPYFAKSNWIIVPCARQAWFKHTRTVCRSD